MAVQKRPEGYHSVTPYLVVDGAAKAIDFYGKALGATVVGRGTKMSNAVTVGHGTRIGPHNLLVAQVGIAGSVETGSYVVLGGQAGVAGHLRIGDGAQVAGGTGVAADLDPGGRYGGAPAAPLADVKRVWMHQKRLPALAATVKRLERRVKQLEERNP